jgi:hypothetical protein
MANSFMRILPAGQREGQPKFSKPNSARRTGVGHHQEVLAEHVFQSMLSLERRRAERSDKPFVLMLLDANLENGAAEEILMDAVHIVVTSKRETDLAGWYKQSAILGIIFTEVNLEGEIPVTETLRKKIETSFVKHLGRDRAAKIAISMHLFPEMREKPATAWEEDSKVYAVLNKKVS